MGRKYLSLNCLYIYIFKPKEEKKGSDKDEEENSGGEEIKDSKNESFSSQG